MMPTPRSIMCANCELFDNPRLGTSPLVPLLQMLSDGDRTILEFEGCWWHYPGPKDRAIREYLGMSATRYYQVLRRLLDDPEAEREASLTIRRLRRVRERARQRAVERRLGEPGG